MSRSKTFGASLLVAAAALAPSLASAQTITKAATGTELTTAANWTGGAVPGATNIAEWSSTSLGAGLTHASSLTWQGINVTGALSDIAINAGSATPVLSIGSSGITLTGTRNLTLGSSLAFTANQSWSLAGGRTLTLIAASRNATGTGNISVSQSGTGVATVIWNQNGNNASWSGYSGNITIGSNVKVQTQGNGAAALGSGIVTLAGGAVHQRDGSWTFGNTFGITADSTIGQDSSNGVGRLMKLLGDLGSTNGSGLTFTNTVTGGTRTDNVGIILAGANASTYGATTISANTRLRVGGNSEATIAGTGVGAAARGSLGTGAVSLAASTAELAFTRTDSHTVANAISGAGTVVIGGNTTELAATASQVVTLSGTSTYTGATRVSRSRLNLTGSLTSAITVDNSGSISGSGSTTGLLTLSSGSAIALAGGATTTSLTVNGATFSGSNLVTFLNPAAANAVYDVFNYGNGAVTGIANLTVAWRGTLSDDTTNKKYIFTAGSSGTRTWNTTTGTWEQNGAANFAEGDQKFYGGDAVVFGNIAADSAITLVGAIAPASVAVSNAANTYTFSGTSIAGTASLTKSGNGTLVLSTAHTYSGGTSISAGTVRLGNASSLGSGAITVSGGTIDIAGFAPVNTLSLAGSGNGANPALWNSAATGVTLAGAVTLASDASVGNGSTTSTTLLTLGNPNLNGKKLTISAGAVSIDVRRINDGDIEVASGGTLYTLTGGSLAAVTGTITVKTGGRMETRDTDNTAMTAVHGIVLDGGALSTAVITNNNGGGAGTILKNDITVTSAGGSLVGNNTAFGINLRLTGALSGSGNLEIAGAQGVELRGDATNYLGTATVTAGTLTLNSSVDQGFGGVIAGTRPVTKSGSGTLTLLGANSYSGATTINAGTLKFSSAANQSLSGNVSGAGNLTKVGNGTLTLSGVASLSGNVTVDGGTLVLGNNNTLTGGVTVTSGTLQLGSGATAGFIGNAATVTNNARIVWNRTSDTNVGNAISGSGSIVNEGSGSVNLTGANTYSGTTTITSGTICVGNAGTTGSLGSGEVINNSALAFNRSDAFTVANVISGTGTVTKLGASSVTLTGANTYTGATSVSNGSLLVGATGSIGSSAVTVASGATFGGSGSAAGNVLLSSGATLAPGIASVGTLSVGSLTFGAADGDLATVLMTVGSDGSLGASLGVGGNIVTNGGAGRVTFAFGSNLSLLPQLPGADDYYTLVTYTGDQLANLDAFAWSGSRGGRQTLNLVNGTKAIGLKVGNAFVRWSGAQGASWSSANNWIVSSTDSPDTFVTGDVAVFDDTASTGSLSISGGSVTASTVTFSGDTLAYDLTSPDGSGLVAASLVKQGAATVTLSTANTLSGGSRIAGGTLVLGDAGALGSASIQLATGGSLDINGLTVANALSLQGGAVIGAGTLSGVVSGTSALVRNSAGVLVLSSANTYSGGTTLASGTVRLGNAAALGTGAVSVSGGTLDIAGFAPTNSLTLAGSGAAGNPALWNSASTAVTLGAVTLSADASVGNGSNDKATALLLGATNLAGNTLTLSTGAVSINTRNFSSGNIVIASGATLYTDNGANTYAAPTGTITIDAGGRMETRDTDNTAQASAHTIVLNGGALSTGVLANNNGGGLGTILRNDITVDAANGGSIVGNNTAFAINLRLTGSIRGSGALDIGGAQGVELRGDATDYTGAATVSNGTLTLNTSTSQGFGGAIAGSRPLVKSGAGTTTLLAANTMSGTVAVNAGTLALSGAGSLASAASITLSASGATLDISGASSGRSVRNLSGVAGTALSLGSNALTVDIGTDLTFAGAISGGGSLTKSGASALTLSSANSFSGGFTLSAGTLSILNNGALGSGTFTANGGAFGSDGNNRTLANALALGGNVRIGGAGLGAGAVIIDGAVDLGGSTRTLDINPSVVVANQGAGVILNGVISNGGITKDGAGVLTALNNGNTFAGPTVVNAGRLVINQRSFAGSSSLSLVGTSILTLSENGAGTHDIRNFSGDAGTAVATDWNTTGTASARSLNVDQSVDGTYAGGFTQGTGARVISLVKSGSAVLSLTGAANTYTGSTTVNAGTLRIGGSGRINNGAYAGAITIAANATLRLDSTANQTLSGAITSSGTLRKSSSGNLTLSGASTFGGVLAIDEGRVIITGNNDLTASISVASVATLQVGNGGAAGFLGNAAAIDNAGALEWNRSNDTNVGSVISGAGSITKLGAAILGLGADNSLSGTVTITAGTLRLGNGGTSGSAGTGNIVNNAALAFNRTDTFRISNLVSGTGTVTQAGAGTAILVASNSYSGTTTVSNGTLQVGDGAAAGTLGSGSVTNNANLAFNRSDDIAVANVISGTGSLTKLGNGKLTLSSANSFTGGTTVSVGTLKAGDASAFGTGILTLADGATLDFDFLDVANVVVLNGGSLINVRTGGSVSLGGSVTAAYLSNVAASTVTLAAGATADLSDVSKTVVTAGNSTLSGLTSFRGTLAVSGGSLDLSDVGNRPLVGSLELRAGGTVAFGASDYADAITYKGGAVTGAFSGDLNVSGTSVALTAGALSGGKVVVATGNSVAIGANFDRAVRLEGGAVASGLAAFAGTLELGDTASLSLTSDPASLASVVVDNGAVLRGTGTVAALTVASGGQLSPGNSPGLTTVTGDLVLLGGGILNLEILNTLADIGNPAAGTDYDSVLVQGTLDLSGLSADSIGGKFIINLISLAGLTTPGPVGDFDPSLAKVYDVYTYSGEPVTSHTGSLVDLFTLNTDGFVVAEGVAYNPASFTLFHNAAESKIQLVYAPIPEPSTYGLILGGLALAGAAIRRRRAKRA